MSALQVFSLVFVAALIGATHASCYGRVRPVTPVSSPCCYGDDLNALLLLGKAADKPCNDVNANELIKTLLNALVYVTTGPGGSGGSGGAGGSGGTGGTGGSGGAGGSKPPSSGDKPPVIDLSLLTADKILELDLLGQTLLALGLGTNGNGGLLSGVGSILS